MPAISSSARAAAMTTQPQRSNKARIAVRISGSSSTTPTQSNFNVRICESAVTRWDTRRLQALRLAAERS
jgi:hypothetical protein